MNSNEFNRLANKIQASNDLAAIFNQDVNRRSPSYLLASEPNSYYAYPLLDHFSWLEAKFLGIPAMLGHDFLWRIPRELKKSIYRKFQVNNPCGELKNLCELMIDARKHLCFCLVLDIPFDPFLD